LSLKRTVAGIICGSILVALPSATIASATTLSICPNTEKISVFIRFAMSLSRV